MKISTLRALRDSTECNQISAHVRALRSIREEQHSRVASVVRAVRAARSCRFSVKLKARAMANGNYAFSGLAYSGGVMYPTITVEGQTTRGPVVLDLDTLTISDEELPVLDDHDESPEGVIGRTLSLSVDDGALPVRGVIYGTKRRAAPYIAGARKGKTWQLSVGTDGFTSHPIAKGERVQVNGRWFVGPLSVIVGAHMTDLSFVEKGADDRTSATIQARRGQRTRLLALS